MKRSFLLVNTNTARPPVSPIGLEYTGEALVTAGVPVHVLDLSFETDWKAALARKLNESEPLAIGLTVRNTDDCSYVTRKSFLPWISEVIDEVRQQTRAFVLLGGVGFSIMPELILRLTRADAGIAGDSEEMVQALAACLAGGNDYSHLPNLVYRRNGDIVRNPRADVDLQHLPLSRRRLVDNKRYQQEGAMVGIETKRGCAEKCIFCADPVAKGRTVRLRPPMQVVLEFRDLLAQDVSWFHLCDSEFNLPIAHAKEVCSALIQAGLGDKLNWYCYCSPAPFDIELAELMKGAGCAGINFGVDSLCDEQLRRLEKSFSTDDIHRLVQILKKAGLNYIFDLLIGGPGETEETVTTTIEKVKQLNIPLAGIAAGVRVYHETPLAQAIANGTVKAGQSLMAGQTSYDPVFYLSPQLGSDVSALINELVAGDSRFLVLSSPEEEGSYNYADDETLCRTIKEGARGAYWDIISRARGG